MKKKWNFVEPSILPGFKISMGFTILYLTLLLIIPLFSLFTNSLQIGLIGYIKIIFSKRVLSAINLSFYTAFIAALINLVFGGIVAWVIVRYKFPGKKILDAAIDLPFALPTAVAGIALTAIYSKEGSVGALLDVFGIQVAFTPIGIIVALIFIGIPFVVRTIEPVLQDFDQEIEEAAMLLGASRFVAFRKVILPEILPALLTGFSMAFARGLGEYGSVIFIAGNIPYMSEIVPLLIAIELEQYNYDNAMAIAATMLVISFVLLLLINLMQKRVRSN